MSAARFLQKRPLFLAPNRFFCLSARPPSLLGEWQPSPPLHPSTTTTTTTPYVRVIQGYANRLTSAIAPP